MINYEKFNTTENHSFNLYNAVKWCRDNECDGIVFNKGRYDFTGDMASEEVLHISNHDVYGIKRIAFLIKDMKNFTIDGGGSEFMFHNAVMPFAVVNSENITLKNFSIDVDDVMTLDLRVIDANEKYFDAEVVNNGSYKVEGDNLYLLNSDGDKDIYHYLGIRARGEDKSFIPESKDEFRAGNPALKVEDLGDRKLRIYGSKLYPAKGMRLITRGSYRFALNIAIDKSKDILLENVTMYKSYAMGLCAEMTENVTVDGMTVKAKDGELLSLNCDATHFIHCKGLVTVKNSSFSEQQDDAINIHGIFTRIVDKSDDYILIKYMQRQAKGIDIYKKGSTFQVLNPKTLIPKGIYEIKDVEVINLNYTKIYVKGGTASIDIGDDVEDLTWQCDLVFENNRVTNNRARGMLIAAKGNVLIKNNYFNTPGVAILFESDGNFWFESGGTNHIEISGNTFENCCYTNGNWGRYVIQLNPREEFDGENYYHKYIKISDNKFINCEKKLLLADNVEKIELSGNNVDVKAFSEFANIKEIV